MIIFKKSKKSLYKNKLKYRLKNNFKLIKLNKYY